MNAGLRVLLMQAIGAQISLVHLFLLRSRPTLQDKAAILLYQLAKTWGKLHFKRTVPQAVGLQSGKRDGGSSKLQLNNLSWDTQTRGLSRAPMRRMLLHKCQWSVMQNQ